MEVIRFIGVIASIIFLIAYIASKVIIWFAHPGSTLEKVSKILEYVTTGAWSIAAACGIIHLFA